MRQQKSESFSNFADRLKSARENAGLTQEQLAARWEFSSGNYIYLMESGKKPVPRKLRGRINELEDEVRARQLDKLESGMTWRETESVREPPHKFALQSLSMDVLMDLFKSLASDMQKAEGAERNGIVESLNAVHEEMQRRERDVILHEKKKPQVSSVLTSQEAGVLNAAVAMIPERGDDEGSGQSPGVGEPPDHKQKPPLPSSTGTKARRPAPGAKGRT